MIIFCLLTLNLPALAVENPFEISLAAWPPIGLDVKYGDVGRLNLDLGYFITKNIELQLGLMFGIRTKATSEKLLGIYEGALYNFSEDHLRSFVLGGGVGFANHYSFTIYEPDSPSSVYFYARAGKRFLLSESYQITYFPYIEAQYGFRTGDELFSGAINAFNFSIVF